MKDKEWTIGKLYIRLQLSSPFLVKRWCFVKRKHGWCFVKRKHGSWNLHLFPLHFHYDNFTH